ncbi:MAG: MarR family EPS-associated transcriptional regulator, partial [Bacteroidetes bacterium]|nr:MarR family EPS-associated transcriptional regulator [Bacteroidota bacterium]
NRAVIIELLTEQLPKLQGVYLFGSQADGTARAHSDYDIAFLVEWGHSPSRRELWRLSLLLAKQLRVDYVDLIDLQNASTVFRFEIVSTGERIFTKDEDYCATFEMTVYSMYQRLNFERREILEDIKKRGYIYER